MPIITTLASKSSFPHPPVAVDVTANQWRVCELHIAAPALAWQCKADVEIGVMFFNVPGTDGPTDGLASNSGSYQLADQWTFTGDATAADRSTPSIPLGSSSDPTGKPKYVAFTCASSTTVLVSQIGSDR